ncbi:MAG: histidinol-phosphate transaminase [Gammaproteobacteria bacterium]|nr:histidinol-phosphate transaminase [Gammaproteobacteria bacterium]MDH5591455.1 histidinol-phosphate transaminase [Gammaproteobacteria bacterium]
MNFCDLALSCITELQPYVPGKPIEELQRELGITDIVKLASNENPLGPSETVLSAISNASQDITRYPDGNGFILKSALAEKYHLNTDQITLGNGSNDVLELIARAFVSPDDEVIYSQYAFAVYPLVTQAIGAKAIIAPARDYGHDLQAMSILISSNTKLIFIANPNNPTGSSLAGDELEAFISQVPEDTLVVLDEAYVEYGDEQVNTISWLAKYSNLIITRTFSKAYGLAGLRVGYALSHPDVADLLNRIRQPFNVNSLALVAATTALNDDAYIAQTKQINEAGMAQLTAGFEALGLCYIPSKGNFITVDVQRNGNDVFQALLEQGVIVRPVGNYGLPQHLRVSIGLQKENQRFLDALVNTLGQGNFK